MLIDVMEPVSKSAGRDLNSPRKESVVEDEDRLSFLPNHVGHHILSFLTIEDIAKLSLASKKCEKLCLTIPSVTIDVCDINLDAGSDELVHFMDFLVSFMKRRKGAKLASLRISWHVDDLAYKETNRIMWLLNHAIGCHVNNIFLDLNFDDIVFVMPMDIFWSESLTSLTLVLSRRQLEFPSPYGFSNLKELRIEDAQIANDSLGEWISSVCKFLEVLRLVEIFGMKKFKISSQSLLEIHISRCWALDYLDISAQPLRTINLDHRSDSSLSLNIYAPNLLILRCPRICIASFSLKKFKLDSFVLRLSLPSTRPIWTDEFRSLLSSIVHVTELYTDCFSVQVLYENNCLPFSFRELKIVHLNSDGLTDHTLPATALFLHGLPHSLKMLRLKRGFGSSRACLKSWGPWNFSFLSELEEFEIDIRGDKNEDVLIEYLLENAKRLKLMRIFSTQSMSTKLAYRLIAAACEKGAHFSSLGIMMELELKPQLKSNFNKKGYSMC